MPITVTLCVIGVGSYWPKHCGNNNKDEDNSPKTLNEKIIKLCQQLIFVVIHLPDDKNQLYIYIYIYILYKHTIRGVICDLGE